MYFQIRDDYCNLSLKEYSENKSFCEDLTEGKFSFPIIHAIQSQSQDKQVLRELPSINCYKGYFIFIFLIDILRQRTRDVEVKKYCVSLLEKTGSFRYTREILDSLDKEVRSEVEQFGPNPIMTNLLDELLSWKTTAD